MNNIQNYTARTQKMIYHSL